MGVSRTWSPRCSGADLAQLAEGWALGHVWEAGVGCHAHPRLLGSYGSEWGRKGLLPCWAVQGSLLSALPGRHVAEHQPQSGEPACVTMTGWLLCAGLQSLAKAPELK